MILKHDAIEICGQGTTTECKPWSSPPQASHFLDCSANTRFACQYVIKLGQYVVPRYPRTTTSHLRIESFRSLMGGNHGQMKAESTPQRHSVSKARTGIHHTGSKMNHSHKSPKRGNFSACQNLKKDQFLWNPHHGLGASKRQQRRPTPKTSGRRNPLSATIPWPRCTCIKAWISCKK